MATSSNVVYNSLFGAQSPDGRRICYWIPFEGKRVYYPRETFCCPNNNRRIMSELPEMIYYTGGRRILVNLYTTSTAKVKVPSGESVTVTQTTNYPRSGRVEITVDPARPARFAIVLRIPSWAGSAALAVNGEPAGNAQSGMHTLDREWMAGDKVTIEMPMKVRLVKGRRAQAGRAAVMYGPLVFGVSRANLTFDRRPEADAAGLQALDLRDIYIDPRTVELLPAAKGEPLRCAVRAWLPNSLPIWNPPLRLLLNEYMDHDVEAIYFKVPREDYPLFAEDELMKRAAGN